MSFYQQPPYKHTAQWFYHIKATPDSTPENTLIVHRPVYLKMMEDKKFAAEAVVTRVQHIVLPNTSDGQTMTDIMWPSLRSFWEKPQPTTRYPSGRSSDFKDAECKCKECVDMQRLYFSDDSGYSDSTEPQNINGPRRHRGERPKPYSEPVTPCGMSWHESKDNESPPTPPKRWRRKSPITAPVSPVYTDNRSQYRIKRTFHVESPASPTPSTQELTRSVSGSSSQ